MKVRIINAKNETTNLPVMVEDCGDWETSRTYYIGINGFKEIRKVYWYHGESGWLTAEPGRNSLNGSLYVSYLVPLTGEQLVQLLRKEVEEGLYRNECWDDFLKRIKKIAGARPWDPNPYNHPKENWPVRIG